MANGRGRGGGAATTSTRHMWCRALLWAADSMRTHLKHEENIILNGALIVLFVVAGRAHRSFLGEVKDEKCYSGFTDEHALAFDNRDEQYSIEADELQEDLSHWEIEEN